MTTKISSLVPVVAGTFLLAAAAAHGSTAPTFTYEKQIVSTGSKSGNVSVPFGLAVDSQGTLYVSQWGTDWIRVFDSAKMDNAPPEIIGQPGSGPAQFDDPAGLAVDESGYLFVADSGNERVQRFSTTAPGTSYKGSFVLPPAPGGNPDEASAPTGIARAPSASGRLYVSSINNPVANLVQLVTSNASAPPVTANVAGSVGVFEMPVGIATDQVGRLYVADATEHQIAVYSSYDQGHELLRVFGKFGADAGELNYPVGIAVDSLGRVYVTEYGGTAGGSRIQVFTSFEDGNESLTTFSLQPTAQLKFGFRHLTGIAIDGTRVYVGDVSCVEGTLAPCETNPSEDAIWRLRFDDVDGDGVFDPPQEAPDEPKPTSVGETTPPEDSTPPPDEPWLPGLTFSDSGAPSSFITVPRKGTSSSLRKVRRKLRRIAGYAIDEFLVAKVEVAVVVRKRSRCKALTRAGLRRASCRKPRYLSTRLLEPQTFGGKQRWTLRPSRRQLRALRRGRYRISSRATDLTGNVERSLVRNKNLRIFQVR